MAALIISITAERLPYFLRPHEHNHHKVLNEVDDLKGINNMPGKWQMLIALGQQTILNSDIIGHRKNYKAY